MSAPNAPKLKKTAILGRENVPDNGVLIIPSQLDYHDALHLEQLLDGRRLVYLAEQNGKLNAQIREHLEHEHVQGLAFVPDNTHLEALRKEVAAEVSKGAVVIYLPSETAAQSAPLTVVPGGKLELLMQLGVPVLPLYVEHTNDLVM